MSNGGASLPDALPYASTQEAKMQVASTLKPEASRPGTVPAPNWKAIDSDPRFQTLHRKKMAFLWGLMVFSMVYYFLLPIGAAYFQDQFKIKLWGPVNFGIVFALSEFVV